MATRTLTKVLSFLVTVVFSVVLLSSCKGNAGGVGNGDNGGSGGSGERPKTGTVGEAPSSQLGLYVENGKVMLGGKEFYGIGTNYHDAAFRYVTNPLCDDIDVTELEEACRRTGEVFYHAMLNYDVQQSEVEFGLYAKICITNALVSQLRVLKRRRQEQYSEGMEAKDAITPESDPVGRILEEERLRELLDSPNMILEYGKKAFDCGKRNHDETYIKQVFIETFTKAVDEKK